MPTIENLNFLPFGAYNMRLGMELPFIHRTKVDYYEKAIECLDDDGGKRGLRGKKKPTLMRMVTSMQAKHSHRKGCLLYTLHISSGKGLDDDDGEVLRRYTIL